MKTLLRRLLFIFLGLVVLIALFYAEEDWRGKRAWENYKQKWEAKGERFDFASFIPKPVPDDQNFALSPIVASCYNRVLDKNGHRINPPDTNVSNRLEMNVSSQCIPWPTNHDWSLDGWRRGSKIDLAGWQEYYRSPAKTNYNCPVASNLFPTLPQPQSPAADVLFALSKYNTAIEELRQASRLPYSRFPLNYDAPDPAEILIPHCETLKSCASVLRLRAVAELSVGQNEKALDDIKLTLYLANSLHDEPWLLSQKQCRYIVDCAIQAIWEGLADHNWSETHLASIEQELVRFDFPADYCHTIRSERAMQLKTIAFFRDNRSTNSILDMNGDPCFWPTLLYRLSPKRWFDINELGIARICQASLPTQDEIGQQVLSPSLAMRSADAYGMEVSGRFLPYHFFIDILCPSFGSDTKQFASAQASVDMATVACALERYRLAHGEYPESLDALVPQFIEKLPHDIIGGAPLHYHRTSDGKFLLYSVGWNETDDGGQMVLKEDGSVDRDKGDWVWQYPAK